MKRRIIAGVLSLLCLLALPGCGTAPQSAAPAPAADDTVRLYTDDCGRTVALPEEITSLAASGPVAQIIVFALAPDLLAGLASRWSAGAADYIPAEYLSLPYLGQLFGSADLNVEELARTAPQLLLDVGETTDALPGEMDRLQGETQIPAVHVESSLPALPRTYRELGALLGREEQAEELAVFCERVYGRALDLMEQMGDGKVRTLYVLGEDGNRVLARDSYHAQVLDLLTDNVAAISSPASRGLGNEVTAEQIALWDPDFLLFAPDSGRAELWTQPFWQDLHAVEAGSFATVPEGPYNWLGMPPSAQCLLGLIWLPPLLYPEQCDWDVQAEVCEFYRLFYHCELTAQQAAALMKNG